MSRHSIVGSGSSMPEDMYLKKYEQTCIYEDPEQMENHFRKTLKDMRCSETFFESDAPRRDNYSRDFLNLRHSGRRTTTEPYLPEGTFLDYEFTIKDPRGIATQPDMMQYRKQQEARGRFIKHGNDEDNSVVSSGWNPSQVVKDIKSQFYNLKNRMKIFDESMNSRHNGGVANTKLTSTGVCMQESDEKAPIMRDEMCYNRSNYINDLSNDMPMGWRNTTDHIFKIAKYGQLRVNAPLSTQNWNKNRLNSRVEHDVVLAWQGANVPKSITLKMIDMARKKQRDVDAGKTVLLSEGKDSQVRSRKLSAKDLSGINSRPTDETRAESANEILKAERAPHKGSHPILDSNLQAKVVIDPYIIQFMGSFNRKMAPREIDDLRDQIEQSALSHGVLVEQKNQAAAAKDSNNELLWQSEANFVKGKSMKVANYSKLAANVYITNCGQQNADFERYHKNSKTSNQRVGKLYNNMYNMETLDYDNEYRAEVDAVKQVGKMGTKYMRQFMDKGDIENSAMSGITARNSV